MSVTLAQQKPPIDPDAIARKTLNGKPATNRDFAKIVANLMLGNKSKGILPMQQVDIQKKLGYKDKKSIRQFKELAIYLGYIELDKKGKAKIPTISASQKFIEFTKKNPFNNNEYVSKWIDDLNTRKQGKPIDGARTYIRCFEIFCNTLKINPDQLLIGSNRGEILQQGRELMKQFLKMYESGQAKTFYKETSYDVDLAIVAYRYSKAVRDFMRFYDYPYPKGETGIMSQNIRAFHGKYAELRLGVKTLEIDVDDYIIQNYGLDSDTYRFFWFGVESCSREKAILGASTMHTKHTSKKTGVTTYIFEVYESKTKQINQGIWKKYIRRPRTIESIELVMSRNSDRIIENQSKENLKQINANLKDIYRKFNLDKIEKYQLKRGDPSTAYVMRKPYHTLRHLGAHYWLEKKKYSYGLVAKLGGWKTIDELKDSYGEMPPEVVLSLLEDEEQVGA